MVLTYSATPLDAVLVEQGRGHADVWLRRNIVHDWHDEGESSYEFWTAEEVHGTMPAGTTKEEVEASFDLLWWVLDDGRSDRELAAEAIGGTVVNQDAILELAVIADAAPTAMSDIIDAVMEIAEKIDEMEGK